MIRSSSAPRLAAVLALALALALAVLAAAATAAPALAAADLDVVADAAVIPPGENGSYGIYVSNNGPDASVPFSITDDLSSSDASFVAASGTGWSCTVVPKTLTCTYSDSLALLDTADDLTVTISGPSAAGTYGTHRITLTAPGDPDTTDNVVTDVVRVAFPVDASPVLLGQAMTADQQSKLHVSARNSGTDPTTAPIAVAVTLPASVALVGVSGLDWSCTTAGQTVSCSYVKSVDPFKYTPTLSLTVTPSRDAYPRASVTAQVTMAGDQNPANDSITHSFAVSTYPDLVAGVAAPATSLAWMTGGWPITLVHTGPSMGGPTTVTITGSTTLAMQGAAGPAWSCQPPAGQAVTCTTANVNQFPVLTLNAVPKGAAPAAVSVAVAGTGDGNPSNNGATANVTPGWAPDLAPAVDGRSSFVTIAVRNVGGSPNNGAVVATARLTGGLRFRSAAGTGWTCRRRGSGLRCRTERLVFPSAALPTVRARIAPKRGSHARSVRVSVAVADVSDTNAANNAAHASVRLRRGR